MIKYRKIREKELRALLTAAIEYSLWEDGRVNSWSSFEKAINELGERVGLKSSKVNFYDIVDAIIEKYYPEVKS